MIRAEHVSYSYRGNVQTVRDLSFHIQKGEFVAILGENGAGKTTTVKLIDGLLCPTSGQMFVNGLDTAKTRVSERAKQVGFLFQNPDRQICQSTVREEIAFGLRAVWGKKETEKIEERTDELLRLFSFAVNVSRSRWHRRSPSSPPSSSSTNPRRASITANARGSWNSSAPSTKRRGPPW